MAEKKKSGILGSNTLLSIDKTNEDQKGRWTEIRVVEWLFTGGKSSRKLEKREFFRAHNGEAMTGKVQGLGQADVIKLRPHLEKLVDLLLS